MPPNRGPDPDDWRRLLQQQRDDDLFSPRHMSIEDEADIVAPPEEKRGMSNPWVHWGLAIVVGVAAAVLGYFIDVGFRQSTGLRAGGGPVSYERDYRDYREERAPYAGRAY